MQKSISEKAINQLDKSVGGKIEAMLGKQLQTQFQTYGKQALQVKLIWLVFHYSLDRNGSRVQHKACVCLIFSSLLMQYDNIFLGWTSLFFRDIHYPSVWTSLPRNVWTSRCYIPERPVWVSDACPKASGFFSQCSYNSPTGMCIAMISSSLLL